MIIHGKAVCDSSACSCRRLNVQQTALLDQWCVAGIKGSEIPTHIQKTDGLVESKPVLEINKVVVEQKCEMEEDQGKIHSEEERQRFRGMVTDTGGACALKPALGLSCQSSSYQAAPSSTLGHADSDNHDLLKRSQASQDCTIGNKFFEPTVDGAEEHENDGSKVPEQLTSGLFTSEHVDGTRESEAQVINERLVYDLSALLTDSHAQPFTTHTWLQPAPTGWHFPVGNGLSEVVYHPLQFPGTSYYHGFQENTNLEGTFFPNSIALYYVLCSCYVQQKDLISVHHILPQLSNLLLDIFQYSSPAWTLILVCFSIGSILFLNAGYI